MNSEEVKHVINAHFKKLNKYSKKITKDFDVEIIHQFRIEYKKLRAFLRMTSYNIFNTGEIKIPKNLKKAYRIAGSIRDLQLHQKRVEEAIKKVNKKPKEYIKLLEKEIKKLQTKLTEKLAEQPVNESKRNTLKSIPDEFVFNNFKDFAIKSWSDIYGVIASKRYSDDDIHSIRKCLKNLRYNLKSLNGSKSEPSSQEALNAKTKSYLDELLEELGNFQDKRTAISLLETYRQKNSNALERELLLGLKYDWLKEKKNMKQPLTRKLETELAPEENATGRSFTEINSS